MYCSGELACSTSSSQVILSLKWLFIFLLKADWQLLFLHLMKVKISVLRGASFWWLCVNLHSFSLSSMLTLEVAFLKQRPLIPPPNYAQIWDLLKVRRWICLSRFTGVSPWILQECKMELNDEEGHRCYPLNGHLLCHSCHLKNIQGCSASIVASSYWQWRETPGGFMEELPKSYWLPEWMCTILVVEDWLTWQHVVWFDVYFQRNVNDVMPKKVFDGVMKYKCSTALSGSINVSISCIDSVHMQRPVHTSAVTLNFKIDKAPLNQV